MNRTLRDVVESGLLPFLLLSPFFFVLLAIRGAGSAMEWWSFALVGGAVIAAVGFIAHSLWRRGVWMEGWRHLH